MTNRHPPISHIAGCLAAQKSHIPPHELAQAVVARLDREGFVIVPRDQAGAYEALQALDTILALRDAAGDEELVKEWSQQMGMDRPDGLMAALVAVRAVLDGPRNAPFLSLV